MQAGGERLQKYLADRDVASRRAAARLIARGHVRVDGETVLEPGFRVDPDTATVTVDGRRVDAASPVPRTIMLHKPRGYVCSRAPQGNRTVFDLLRGVDERIEPVGRLDKDTEGLLLLSSNGDLVLKMTHPRYGHRKRYEVTVAGPATPAKLERLRRPFDLEGYRTRPARVRLLRPAGPSEPAVIEIELREGRKRQIREMCRVSGLRVLRLVRTQFGGLVLGNLAPGQWRDLSKAEQRTLVQPGR
jgi:23S rRNA pseudouridine2605 synthase